MFTIIVPVSFLLFSFSFLQEVIKITTNVIIDSVKNFAAYIIIFFELQGKITIVIQAIKIKMKIHLFYMRIYLYI